MVEVEKSQWLSESNCEFFCATKCVCVKALCSIEMLALCLDLVQEGGSGAQCADLLSYAKLGSVAQFTGADECNIQKKDKEDEVVGGRSLTLG